MSLTLEIWLIAFWSIMIDDLTGVIVLSFWKSSFINYFLKLIHYRARHMFRDKQFRSCTLSQGVFSKSFFTKFVAIYLSYKKYMRQFHHRFMVQKVEFQIYIEKVLERPLSLINNLTCKLLTAWWDWNLIEKKSPRIAECRFGYLKVWISIIFSQQNPKT